MNQLNIFMKGFIETYVISVGIVICLTQKPIQDQYPNISCAMTCSEKLANLEKTVYIVLCVLCEYIQSLYGLELIMIFKIRFWRLG